MLKSNIKIQKSILALKKINGHNDMHKVLPLNGKSTSFELLPGCPQFCKLEVKGREGPANFQISYPN